MFWDFGAGQIGDMGSHTMDLLWNAVDAKLPTSAEAKGEKFNPDVTPVECESHFEHPGQRLARPDPRELVSGRRDAAARRSPTSTSKKIDHGAMFKGSKGFLIADFDSRMLLPFGDNADLTYYKPRTPETVLPPLGHFQKQWIDACKDPSLKTACDFEYSGNMIEQMLLGLVAYRVGKKISLRRRHRPGHRLPRGQRPAAAQVPRGLDAQRVTFDCLPSPLWERGRG